MKCIPTPASLSQNVLFKANGGFVAPQPPDIHRSERRIRSKDYWKHLISLNVLTLTIIWCCHEHHFKNCLLVLPVLLPAISFKKHFHSLRVHKETHVDVHLVCGQLYPGTYHASSVLSQHWNHKNVFFFFFSRNQNASHVMLKAMHNSSTRISNLGISLSLLHQNNIQDQKHMTFNICL